MFKSFKILALNEVGHAANDVSDQILLFKNEGKKLRTGFEVTYYTLSLENEVVVTPDSLSSLGNVRPLCCHGV